MRGINDEVEREEPELWEVLDDEPLNGISYKTEESMDLAGGFVGYNLGSRLLDRYRR